MDACGRSHVFTNFGHSSQKLTQRLSLKRAILRYISHFKRYLHQIHKAFIAAFRFVKVVRNQPA